MKSTGSSRPFQVTRCWAGSARATTLPPRITSRRGAISRIASLSDGERDVDGQAAGVGVVVRVHDGHMDGGDASLHVEADGLGGEHLEEARVVVIRLVAMDIDLLVELVGERHRKFHGLLAILPGQL